MKLTTVLINIVGAVIAALVIGCFGMAILLRWLLWDMWMVAYKKIAKKFSK